MHIFHTKSGKTPWFSLFSVRIIDPTVKGKIAERFKRLQARIKVARQTEDKRYLGIVSKAYTK